MLIALLQDRDDEAHLLAQRLPDGRIRDEAMALTCWRLGRKDESAAFVARLEQLNDWRASFQLAEVDAFKGNSDGAFARLEQLNAELKRDPTDLTVSNFLSDLRSSALLIPLRDDSRWQAIWDQWEEEM